MCKPNFLIQIYYNIFSGGSLLPGHTVVCVREKERNYRERTRNIDEGKHEKEIWKITILPDKQRERESERHGRDRRYISGKNIGKIRRRGAKLGRKRNIY